MRKNVLLKVNFQCEGHLDTYSLIYILAIYRQCVLFQFYIRVIGMLITILTVVQKGHITNKNSPILLENVLLKLTF